MTSHWLRSALFCVLALGVALPAAAADDDPLDFNREVKPLLAKHCFRCHGPDTNEGGLRLHERESALAELDSGLYGVVPGRPDESELLRRITATDEFERMPPEGKPLSAEQVATLRRWIADGAEWRGHWAFDDVARPEPPAVRDTAWVANPVDNFILARLEKRGLAPAPAASKQALIRRVTYDLTGLPPTPDEVRAFVADDAPDAYERLVDRLLKSPRYGERWARHWLDVVRFAETNSFERDNNKPHAWRYRDYVIRALNDDKPYDRFIVEQLAGDELPDATPDSLVATGYYRLGLWDDEPADRLLARYDELDDIVSTTGQVFLGMTIGCARCHDHKIDPLPMADYYGLLAFFENIRPMANGGANIERPLFARPDEEATHRQRVADLEERRNAAQLRVTQMEEEFQQLWAESQGRGAGGRRDLDELKFRFYRDSWQRLPDFDNLKPETVGEVPSGLFDISLASRFTEIGFVFEGFLIVPADGQYTFFLDSDDGSRLTIDGRVVLDHDGIHGVGNEKRASVRLAAGRRPIRLDYFQNQHGYGLSVAWSGPQFRRRLLSVPVGDSKPRSNQFNELVRQFGKQLWGDQKLQAFEAARAELEALKKEQVPVDMALCVTENGANPPPTFIRLRGNPHVKGDEVGPRFPAILTDAAPEIVPPAAQPASSGRRLALARWIASPDNKLTARVMVNRLWQHHFGRGIVASTNNFGQLGDPPTHPELLDWLASELVDGGWRLKRMHKLLVMSSAYQMSSLATPAAIAKDPANDLFSRFNMRRLSGEELRDSLYAVNGGLNLAMYGPGFYPTISQEVLAGQSKPGAGWGRSSPEEQARRAVYIHVKRSLITPILESFDFPDTDSSCEARFATTQPTQALAMLNGEFMNQQAGLFAERLRKEFPDDVRGRIGRSIWLALGREPTDRDLARGEQLLARLQAEHGQSPDEALRLYCLMLLNLNEFVYLD